MVRFSKTAVLVLTAVFAAVAVFIGIKDAKWDESEAALFYVQIASPSGQERIDCWKGTEGDYYVFLPSYADPSETKIHLNRDAEIFIDGENVRSGMTCEQWSLNTRYAISAGNGDIEHSYITFLRSENIPAMYIDTRSGNMGYIHADRNHSESGAMRLVTGEGETIYSGKLKKINGRGNSTWEAEKKAYSLELPENHDLLGMGKAMRWVLLANAYDPTHIKNKLVFDFAAQVGLPYTPQGEWVDLYLNGEYAGLYLLCERNEVAPERVDIQEEGSFLLSTDYFSRIQERGRDYVVTANLAPYTALRIRYATMPVSQMEGILQSVENAIVSEDGVDPITGKHWQELIDLDSWARKYLIEEIFASTDSGNFSQFYYYDGAEENGKLYAGPIWDFDLVMRGNNSWSPLMANMFFANREDEGGPVWFHALCQKPEFYNRVMELYEEVFAPLLTKTIEYRMDEYEKIIASSARMNAIRWGEEDAAHAIKEFRENLMARMDFLDRIWVQKEPYCTVRVDRNGRMSIVYAIRPGDCLPEMPEDWENLYENWYLADTNEPFDREKPIYKDTEIYIKTYEEAETAVYQDNGAKLRTFARTVVMILFSVCSILLLWVNLVRTPRRQKTENRKFGK